MKKIRNPWAEKEGYDCFGCAPDNPIGLRMDFYEDEGDIVGIWQPSTHYQGWIDVLHGGIIATLVDETGAWVITRKLQTTAMTVRLNMQYIRPITTTGGGITVRARILRQMRNFVVVTAQVTDDRGRKCATGEATYCAFDKAKASQMGFNGCELE